MTSERDDNSKKPRKQRSTRTSSDDHNGPSSGSEGTPERTFGKGSGGKTRTFEDRGRGRDRKFGDRDPGADRKFSDRGRGGDRKFGDRDRGGDRKFSDRGRGGDRKFSDRGRGGDRKFSDRDRGGDRKFSDRGRGGDRKFSDRGRGGDRKFGDRDRGGDRKFSDRGRGGDRKFSDRDRGGDRKFSDRGRGGDRKFGDRDRGGDRKFSDQGRGGDRKFSDRDRGGDRKFGDRDRGGDRKFSDRDRGGDRKFGDRDRKFGDRESHSGDSWDNPNTEFAIDERPEFFDLPFEEMTEWQQEAYQKAHDTNVDWERRGRLDIAVTKTERWKHAAPVNEDDGRPGVRKIKAQDRANTAVPIAPQEEPEGPADVLPVRPWSHAPSRTGRAVIDPAELLVALMRDNPAWRPLAAPTEEVVKKANQLSDADLERWMGLRNGRAKTLKPPLKQSQVSMESILEMIGSEQEEAHPDAIVTLEQWLESTPADFWAAQVEATRQTIMSQRRANLTDLHALLPEPCDVPSVIPRSLTLPWIPPLVQWRKERFNNHDQADSNLQRAWDLLTDQHLSPSLRQGLEDLNGGPIGIHWNDLGPQLLGEALREKRVQLTSLMEKPAEPAVYVAAARHLIRDKRSWSAEQALRAGLEVEPGHRICLDFLASLHRKKRHDEEVIARSDTHELYSTAAPTGLKWEVRELPQPVLTPDPEPLEEQETSSESTELIGKDFGEPTFTPMARLDTLDLKPGTIKVLETGGITSVSALRETPLDVLKGIRGIGPSKMTEIQDALLADAPPQQLPSITGEDSEAP